MTRRSIEWWTRASAGAHMTRRSIEWWIAVVRLLAVPFAILQVSLTAGYPHGYERVAWLLTGILVVAAVILFVTVRDTRGYRLVAMAFDLAIVSAFALAYAWEPGPPTRQLLFLAIVIGSARFGMRGGVLVALLSIPVAAVFEQQRAHHLNADYRVDFVTFQAGAGLLMALLVGWLVARLDEQRATAEQRAEEAETLRDELGRRADLLEAANRCARALNASLDLDEAFGGFIRELRGLVPFDRMAIVLAEDGRARVMATAGASAEGILASGDAYSTEGNVLGEVLRGAQTIYRDDLTDAR